MDTLLSGTGSIAAVGSPGTPKENHNIHHTTTSTLNKIQFQLQKKEEKNHYYAYLAKERDVCLEIEVNTEWSDLSLKDLNSAEKTAHLFKPNHALQNKIIEIIKFELTNNH